MKDREESCPGKDLEKMSTDQLDELLQKELCKDVPDESVVLSVLQVLQEREEGYSAEAPEGITENLAEYRTRIQTETARRKKRQWTLRAAAVAAVVCVVLMAVPRTVGAESVFQVLYRWTESFFEFLTPGGDKEDPAEEYVFKTDNEGLQQLHETMVAEGVTDPVVPMWIPEGYILCEVKTEVVFDGKKVFAKFMSETEGLLISYQINQNQKTTQYEKADPAVNQYEVDGVSHFVFTNKGRTTVTWQNNGVDCVIGTSLEEETVRKIIASIYRSE